MTIPFIDDFSAVKTFIRTSHVEELKDLPLSSHVEGYAASPLSLEERSNLIKRLTQWSAEGKKQINAAIAKKCVGGQQIDWDISFFTMMEDATITLRDTNLVYEAIVAAKEDRVEDAIELLEKADRDIEKIAQLWNPKMRYVTLCDLLGAHPNGHWAMDGPYCGAFFCLDPATPFIGITFKGTNPTNWQEVIKDLVHDPITPTNGVLWGQQVSKGVYLTLFRPYKQIGGKVAFQYIVAAIHRSVLGHFQGPSIDLHVTGHSLGASYGTLCYAELLRTHHGAAGTQFILRDLWTIGSPRIALEGFVKRFKNALSQHTGFSWRVVNQSDPITMVPPPPLIPHSYNFIHVDAGWRIRRGSRPEQLLTEIGTTTKPPSPAVVSQMRQHYMEAYKSSILYTSNHS